MASTPERAVMANGVWEARPACQPELFLVAFGIEKGNQNRSSTSSLDTPAVVFNECKVASPKLGS